MVGYISDKKQFEASIENEILNSDEINVAFVDLEAKPEYYFMLADKNEQTSEEQILEKIKETAKTTYKLYAITLNNENTTYVNSFEEAEQVVAKIKEDSQEQNDVEIGMQEIYTTDLNKLTSIVEVASAVDTAETKVEEIMEAQERIKASTLDGVYFSTKPVTGIITSRYGDVEDIRDHAHGGLDISAPAGTDIMAAADGVVKFAGEYGGYGNLVIISHENGIESYYGHCSRLYANEGDVVKAGDIIAAVGSTGYSTGNHLHFEIRVDGSTINPQNYIYN